MNIGRISALMVAVLISTAALALGVETPDGYVPWFSVDGEWVPGVVVIQQPSELLVDWRAIQVRVVASNVVGDSEVSEPSDEVLIAPAGTAVPVPGWIGPVAVKGTSGPLRVRFDQPAGGSPTRYTFFLRSRSPIGACARPGKPEVMP